MDNELGRLIEVWTTAVGLICYCYFIASRIPKGIPRLISIFPILYIFTIFPLKLQSVHGCAAITFFFTWLGNSKLLLFAFDNHHILFPPFPNLFHFLAIFCLPIKIKTLSSLNYHTETKTVVEKTLIFALKLLVLVIIIHLYEFKQLQEYPFLIFILNCLNLFLIAEIVLILCSVPAKAVFGSEIDKHFNEPYLSTSLQDFWGRRWNLMVPNILRLTVYNPTRNITCGVFGPRWSRVSATIAAFTVSGLVHELMYYYIIRKSPTWEVTLFFIMHGICTAAEVAMKEAVVGTLGLRIHRGVSWPLTLAFVIVTARWLMFAQLIRNGVLERAVGEYSIMANFVKDKTLGLF